MKRLLLILAMLMIAGVVWASIPASDNFSGTFTTNWDILQGAFTNSGGVAVAGGIMGNENSAAWKTSTDTFSADQSSQALFPSAAGACIAVRGSGVGALATASYVFCPTGASGTAMRLYKQTGGINYLQLGADYGNGSDGDTWKLSVSGGTLTPYINGVAQVTQSDGAVSTGQPMIYGFGDGPTIDNWVGDNVAAAAGSGNGPGLLNGIGSAIMVLPFQPLAWTIPLHPPMTYGCYVAFDAYRYPCG